MALKDWKKQDVGTIGNTTNIIWWQKKGTGHDDRLELFKADSLDGNDWGVEQRKLGKRNFKTKSQAMAFAENYRRRN